MDDEDFIQIDPTDSTLPENYLQLKSMLEKDCERIMQQSKRRKQRGDSTA